MIWPKSQESKILQNNIKVKKEEIKQTKDYFKNLKELKIQLETDYLDELSKIGSALPSGTSMPSFLKFLQESSAQSGLLLRSIDPSTNVYSQESNSKELKVSSPSEGSLPAENSPPVLNNSPKESNLKELKVSLDLEGSYSSFKNFLSVLENSSRLIDTESISFTLADSSKTENGQEKTSSSFKLQIRAFSY